MFDPIEGFSMFTGQGCIESVGAIYAEEPEQLIVRMEMEA